MHSAGNWEAAGPDPGWASGPAQYGYDARSTGAWQAAGPGPEQAWAPGPAQYGQDPQSAGSGQAWAPAPGQYGPGVRTTGPWQAAGPEPGQEWPNQPGQYAHDPRNTGSWQAPEPGNGQGWGAGPQGYEYDPRNAGSSQAAAPGQGQAWNAGPGQYPQDARATGGWQSAGPDWTGPGQQQGQPFPGQYQGQPYPGQPYPGHYPGPPPAQPHQETGRLGEPHYADGSGPPNTGDFGRVGSPVIRQRDSALPDPAPGGRGAVPIAAIESDSVAAFARDLRVLRAKAELDYPDMAEKSHYTMRTLASAAGGLRLPTLPVLIAYVNACDGDLTEWEERWGKLSKSSRKSQVVALPASDGSGVPGGANPPDPSQTGEIYVITTAKMRDEHW